MQKKYLVIGSGGRETTMVWRLKKDDPEAVVYCAPGNPGMKKYSKCVQIEATDIHKLEVFARNQSVDLTIVGPEEPLCAGIVDLFRVAGLSICGPVWHAAKMTEGSKVAFKNFLERNEIPTAAFAVFNYAQYRDALGYIYHRGAHKIVIKADGLMGGKGVYLPNEEQEARNILGRLGSMCNSGEQFVIEERLVGVERSIMAFTDGRDVYLLPFTQDYKRAFDSDAGLNTGGMGAHTIRLSRAEEEEISEILETVVSALAGEGVHYSGFIYLGVMITRDGIKVLECNCRLGDPEAQVALTTMNGNFANLCAAATPRGRLVVHPVPARQGHALCVVLTTPEYPAVSEGKFPIFGIDEAEKEGAIVFPAGVSGDCETLTTTENGRILGVVGCAETLIDAHRVAYKGVGKIISATNLGNSRLLRHRKDIGKEYLA